MDHSDQIHQPRKQLQLGPRVYEDPGLAEVENNEVADTWEISSV